MAVKSTEVSFCFHRRSLKPRILRSTTMRIGSSLIIAAALLVAAAVPVLAHHSFAAEFDSNKPVTLTGSVTKLDWINPHARLFIEVKADGKTANWEIELGPPAIL